MLPKTRVGYFTKGGRGPINIKSFRVFIRTKIITINLSFKGRLTKKNPLINVEVRCLFLCLVSDATLRTNSSQFVQNRPCLGG